MTPIQTIAADIAQELREHPERWTQGCNARDKNGAMVGAEWDGACSWCLYGHVLKRVPDWLLLGDTHAEFFSDGTSIGEWNDIEGRTVADVIALCERVAGIDPTPCPQCQKAGEHKVGCERGTES